ncbi:MAG: type II toxin-antitoxin system RelE/ParE family toxin [Lachnospirales bacterium]
MLRLSLKKLVLRLLLSNLNFYAKEGLFMQSFFCCVFCKKYKNVFTKVIIYDNIYLKEVLNIFEVIFYQKENGKIPVKDFLLSMTPKLRAKAFSDIELLQKYGSELREPYIKPIKGKNNKGLYELRIKFSSDIARIFYFTYYNNKYVLLHGFIKKTMKTPAKEIDKAKKYMEDYIRRADNE